MSGMNGVLENHKFFQFTTQKDDLTLLDYSYYALACQFHIVCQSLFMTVTNNSQDKKSEKSLSFVSTGIL